MAVTVKPGKPRALSVTSDSIELEWTKPEQGAHNVISYSVYHRSASDPPDHWVQCESKLDQQTSTLTVSELSEYTPYYFKVRPECEMGVGVESDISEPVLTKILISSKPGKPRATKATRNSVHLEWTKPEQGAHNITSCTILYHSATDPSDKWRECRASKNDSEMIVTHLSENTAYHFKVRPESNTGIWLESDVSDLIQTEMIVPSKPGKPKISSITHNSVQLEWSKPEQGAHNVTSYTIWYHPANYPQDEWLRFITGDAKENAIVPKLSANMVYKFKIQPEFKGGGLVLKVMKANQPKHKEH